MNRKITISKLELSIVLVVALLLILLSIDPVIFINSSAFGIHFLNKPYLVVPSQKLIFLILILLSLIYIIKEAFYHYKRRFQNLILLVTVLFVNIYFLSITKFFAVFFSISCGRTVYPPLSAMHDNRPPLSSSAFEGRLTNLFYIQIFFLVLLVIIAILTGKNWNSKQSES
jgi:hypothetical protein